MFDILVYVLEHCQRSDVAQDTDAVARKLSDAGFDDPDIADALSWLAGASRTPACGGTTLPLSGPAYRVLAERESVRLHADAHGFLMRLELCGILDAECRERVLERVLAIPGEALSLEQLKLVVLMVLWQRGDASGPLLTEDVFFAPESLSPN